MSKIKLTHLRCSECGRSPEPQSNDWRFHDWTWQHRHGVGVWFVAVIKKQQEEEAAAHG